MFICSYLSVDVDLLAIFNRNIGAHGILNQRILTLFSILFISISAICQTDTIPGGTSDIKFPGDSLKKDSISISLQSKSGLDSKVSYGADDIVLKLKEKKAYLYSNAWITYEDIRLEADYIELDFGSKDLFARGVKDSAGAYVGRPQFTDKGKVYEADTMKYNFESKKGLSMGVLTTEKDGYIHGTKVLRDSMENIYVKEAKFTTCNLPDPHFYISADKIKIIPQKQIVTGPANLVIADIPTPLVVPFGFFPIPEQKSKGLIFPNFALDPTYGYFFRGLGYYFPVNDYLDVQVTTDFYFRGLFGVALRTNYNRRYRYRGSLGVDYRVIPSGEPETPSFQSQRDFKVVWSYIQDPKARPGSNFSANVNFNTSDYNKNFNTDYEAIVRSTNTSSVSYSTSFFKGKLNLSATSRVDQNLSTEDVDITLPQLTVSMPQQLLFANTLVKSKFLRNLGITYTGNFRNEAHVKESTFLSSQVFDSLQNGITHQIPIRTSFKALTWVTVSPNFTFNEFWYFRTTEQTWDDVNDTLLINDRVQGFSRAHQFRFNVSFSTILYGQNQKAFKGPVKFIRHVMRPNFGLTWNPDFTEGKENGYRTVQVDDTGTMRSYSIYENALMGRPSFGPNGSITFGLGNNLEMKVRVKSDSGGFDTKKIKLIENLNINSNYNFLADSLKLADFSFRGNTTILNRLRLNFSTTLDPYIQETDGNRVYTINRFVWDEKKRLGWFTNYDIQASFALNPEAFKRKENPNVNQDELEYINNNPQDYIDFNIPWNVSFNYTYRVNRNYFGDDDPSQSLTLTGEINLTPNWKVRANTSYDLTQKEINLTSFEFYRDLHCWQFNFKWYPIGRRMFEFSINVKSSTLQDLKMNRRRSWWSL